ncbi:LysR substrate-binding domain-containing protein [Fodinicola feengrottensis]|uniref:LysR substrate-binding domain-containing protein n=1 Tax=Fodinicola feengrottensis TaxID=435914 RepID=UPI002440F021|nr:LysR substrate-binding domain-containing protein [Fodinicola feengrottensis]
MPAVLRTLRGRWPDLEASLSELEPHEAIPMLVRADLDIAVAQDWPDRDSPPLPDGISRLALFDDPFDIALPADHPLAGRDQVKITELAAQDWISWSAGQICHDWLAHTLRSYGVEPRIVHTASEHPTQLALVAAGLGAAGVVPRLGRDLVPTGVRFVEIHPQPVRWVFALWRDSSAARPAVRATLGVLRDAVPGRTLAARRPLPHSRL